MGASVNKEDKTKLDVATDGFWGSSKERAFFEIRVFNPSAPTNKQTTTTSTYKVHKRAKKRQYGQCGKEVEHSTFTLIVLSSTGGLGREASSCYKHLKSLLSTKWDEPYSVIMGWLSCCLCDLLLRSSIQCIRGTWFTYGHAIKSSALLPVNLVHSEANM